MSAAVEHGQKPLLCSLPGAQYRARKDALDKAYRRVMDSEWFILGKEVESFEREFAAYCDSKYAIGVANGTEALQLILTALGIGPGDEVITVSYTAVATVAAIMLVGATPVLCDIDESTGLMDLDRIDELVSPKTKAVIGVHLFGRALDCTRLSGFCRSRSLAFIEDCAQAHGARHDGKRVGSFGAAAAFSFYPTKNLGALGDGGAVTTSEDALAVRLRELREYGWRERYVSHDVGMNTRLDELHAAFLREKLPYLDSDNLQRRRIAETYSRGLESIPIKLPQQTPDEGNVWHLYVIQTERRDDLNAALRQEGIFCGIHYPVPVHLQPGYAGHVRYSNLANSENLAKTALSLPIYPELSFDDVGRVVAAIHKIFEVRP